MMLSAQHAQLDRQLDRHTEEQGEGNEAWQQIEGLLLPVLSHFLCVWVCVCVSKNIFQRVVKGFFLRCQNRQTALRHSLRGKARGKGETGVEGNLTLSRPINAFRLVLH